MAEHDDQQKQATINYNAERIIGNGSFGIVYQARIVGTTEIVAIKKVLQDKRFKNRELQIMKVLVKQSHPNIVQLRHCFYSQGENSRPGHEEVYLNLVLEFVPETLFSVIQNYKKNRQHIPMVLVKLYVYQLSRALAHIHAMDICHRDIKPQNVLVDPSSHVLKLCDFGSAKRLIPGEPNVAYICSRYYRAPELIFGNTDYTTAIDVWSQGCVMAELILEQPIFPGESSVDQLVEIIKILGTPTQRELDAMNPNCTDFRFPQIPAQPWQKVFQSRGTDDAYDVSSKMLEYVPTQRISAIEACVHPFFDELRDPNTRLPDNVPMPALFNLTEPELSVSEAFYDRLVPEFAR